MPRDSSGAYTLPTGNPVVDGTVIESEWANDTMADIAVQMNNVLTRDGLLGPIAPMLFVNGTVPLPGIAFQESPSTGLMRLPPNTVQMVINGVVKQAWSPAGTSIVGPISSSGPLGIPAGSVAAPGLFFNGDPDTGMYSPGPDRIGFAAGGAVRLNLSVAGNWVAGPASAGPAFVLAAGPEGVGLDIYGNGVVNDAAAIRFLDNAGTTPRMFIEGNNAGGYIGTLTAIPLTLYAGGTSRVTISATGALTVNTPTAGEHLLGGTTRVVGSAPYVIADGSHATAFRGFQIANSTIVIGALEATPGTGELRLSAGFAGFGGFQTFYTNGLERARLDAAGNLIVGGLAPTLTGSVTPTLQVTNATALNCAIGVFNGGANNSRMAMFADSAAGLVGWDTSYSATFNGFVWRAAATERMRLDGSGNLGIGGAPSNRLTVAFNSASIDGVAITNANNAATLGMTVSGPSSPVPSWLNTAVVEAAGAAGGLLLSAYQTNLIFQTGPRAERMRIDAVGNVGIGTTVNSWSPSMVAMQIAGLALFSNTNGVETYVADNLTFDGANWRYRVTGPAALTIQGTTGISWYTLPSGAGGTVANPVQRAEITTAGVFNYGGREVGYRSLLRSPTSVVGTGALLQSENGICRYHDAGTDLVANSLTDGTIITIFNASGATRLLTAGAGVTLSLAGTGLTGPRTIAVNAFATVWWIGAPGSQTVVVTGPGVT